MKYINPGFINTSEAFSGEILVGNGHMAIPYININLMPGNPINNKHSFINYGYYIFRQIAALELGSDSTIINVAQNEAENNNLLTEHIGVGGYGKSIGAELKILCKEHEFIMIEFSAIKDTHFIPVNTPLFGPNMDAVEVASFFSNKFMPHAIREIIGNKFYKILI